MRAFGRVACAALLVTAAPVGVPTTAGAATLGLSPVAATNEVGTSHTVTFTVVRDNGAPGSGVIVRFSVPSGPNAGQQSDVGECTPRADCRTDANGQASWTYTSNGTAGLDVIRACVGVSSNEKCAQATKEWVSPPVDPEPCEDEEEGEKEDAGEKEEDEEDDECEDDDEDEEDDEEDEEDDECEDDEEESKEEDCEEEEEED